MKLSKKVKGNDAKEIQTVQDDDWNPNNIYNAVEVEERKVPKQKYCLNLPKPANKIEEKQD